MRSFELVFGTLVFSLFVTGASAAPYEVDEATDLAGQLRMLSQRATKQYLMYHYRVGELANTKLPLLDTVDLFDDVVARLRVRNRSAGSAAVGNRKVNAALADVQQQWKTLRKIYQYRPHELWREKSLIPPQVRRQDPVAVKYVDNLTEDLLNATETLTKHYADQCQEGETKNDGCVSLISDTGRLRMLAERIAKYTMFEIYGLGNQKRLSALGDARSQFEKGLEALHGIEDSSDQSSLLPAAAKTVDGYWAQLSRAVDQALEGDPDDIDVDQFLRAQQRLTEELDNVVTLLVGQI